MSITFSDLGLAEPLLVALKAKNYSVPTPIQARAIPHLLTGGDLLGIAQTGTGKTAAFALPILQRLAAAPTQPGRKAIRALILTPTRELATQIGDSFRAYGRNLPLHVGEIFGGVSQKRQTDALAHGLDIVIATPGRLLDLMEQGHVRLGGVTVLVLDEADRMLDLGFIRPIQKIVGRLPKARQSLLFSATMPQEIEHLAAGLLRQPVRVEVTPAATTVERVEQQVRFVAAADKRQALSVLLRDPAIRRALVFTRTKHGADRVARHLSHDGVPTGAIHGDKSQPARQRALEDFRSGRVRVLVATDIAARGIDIDGITHVINFELPNVPESYVHRIGRTARAGADGVAVSFCDAAERPFLRDIEKLIRRKLDSIGERPALAEHAASPGPASALPPGNNRQRFGRRGRPLNAERRLSA